MSYILFCSLSITTAVSEIQPREQIPFAKSFVQWVTVSALSPSLGTEGGSLHPHPIMDELLCQLDTSCSVLMILWATWIIRAKCRNTWAWNGSCFYLVLLAWGVLFTQKEQQRFVRTFQHWPSLPRKLLKTMRITPFQSKVMTCSEEFSHWVENLF